MSFHPLAIVESPAKLNLFLEILGKRADGYHDLDTVMMAIDWCDRMEVRTTNQDTIQLSCQWAGSREEMAQEMGVDADASLLDLPAGPSNLVYRALSDFRAVFQIGDGFDVRLEKKIPAGAGMGGASSNAAASLLAAAKLHSIPSGDSRLQAIAAKIGSDVPFFMGPADLMKRPEPEGCSEFNLAGNEYSSHSLTGQAGAARPVGAAGDCGAAEDCGAYLAARATGTGTVLDPLTTDHILHAVVVFPGISLSTAEVYKYCHIPQSPRSADQLLRFWQSGQTEHIGQHFLNRLSVPAKKLAPRIEDTLESMQQITGCFCQLTGSGSACFAVTDSREQAETFAKQLRFELGTLVQAVSAQPVPALVELLAA